MSGYSKVIRDPVHGIIVFADDAADRLLLELINTREFQRLRRIKQLGMSHMVYPGADHSRFAHSIGVMHMARRFLGRIDELLTTKLHEEQRVAVLAAALLHDIGHGPFSHAFEKVTGENHERRTLEMILDPATEVNQCLSAYRKELPEWLKLFFAEDVEEGDNAGGLLPRFLTQIVSSQFDADRVDYLLRDSRCSGVQYGVFDQDWLLQNLFLNNERQRFFFGPKALLQAEQYVFARYHMYPSVYFHKTTRSAEVVLRLLLKKYKSLLDDAESLEKKSEVVPNSPKRVFAAFAEPLTLSEYLELDDHSMTEFLKACRTASDATIQQLGAALLDRRLFKAVDVTGVSSHVVAEFTDKVRRIVSENGMDADFFFAVDTPKDTAYKLYDPDSDKPNEQLYVQFASGEETELSRASDNVRNLSKKYQLVRYYYPESVRQAVVQQAVPLLSKE